MLQATPFTRQGQVAADIRAAEARRAADIRRAELGRAADEVDGFRSAGSGASGAARTAFRPMARLLALLPHAR